VHNVIFENGEGEMSSRRSDNK